MAVVYVAARIKAGSSVSPLKGATRRSIGPFGTLPRGAFCYLTRGQPVSSLLPPILPLRLLFLHLLHSLSVYIESRDPSCFFSLSFENSGGIRDADTRRPRSCNPFLERVAPATCARDPFFSRIKDDGYIVVRFDSFRP